MANRPHPDKKLVGWRLRRDLIARVQDSAKARGEAVVTFVARALEREIDRTRTDLHATTDTPEATP